MVGGGRLGIALSTSTSAAKIQFKGKGSFLQMPDLAAIGPQLRVQFRSSATPVCWEARYAAPYAKQDAEQLKAAAQ